MTLPFDPTLAGGVLATLAELQGTRYDPVAEEQPGKILHELRRHGGGGPFATRRRYYGTVDATPLFVMLAAEAHRWGALSDDDLRGLAPAVDAADRVDARRRRRRTATGSSTTSAANPAGLSNQGWKDSWDGVTFADGIAARRADRARRGAGLRVRRPARRRRARRARARLQRDGRRADRAGRARCSAGSTSAFWDERGWFAIGLDGDGRQIDSLTTNPGHALWTGIADDRRWPTATSTG